MSVTCIHLEPHLYTAKLGYAGVFSSPEPKAQKVSFGVGSSPALATCETSQVLLAGVSGVFLSGSSRFRRTYLFARLI